MLERRIDPECGCSVEDVVCHGIFMTIHHEDDGTGHIIVDCGEAGEDDFFTGPVKSMEELEQEADKLALKLLEQYGTEER